MLSTFLRRVFCTRRLSPQWHISPSGANRTTGGCANKTDGNVSCDNRDKLSLPELLDLLLIDEEPHDNQPIFKLAAQVCFVADDSALCQALEELRWRCLLFDRLRKAMRIAPVDGGNGLNDEGTAGAMSTIRQGVENFRRELKDDPKLAADPLALKIPAGFWRKSSSAIFWIRTGFPLSRE
jgi:hypothetical protein